MTRTNEPISDRPVFFDPNQKRWPLVRNAFLSLGLLLAILFGLLIVSVVLQPVLPALGLRPAKSVHKLRAAPRPDSAPDAGATRAAFGQVDPKRRPQKSAPLGAPASAGPPASSAQPLTFGYYVNWDPGSFSSLKANIDALDVVVPEWLHVTGPAGTVIEDEPARQKDLREFINTSAARVRVMPLINNFVDDTQKWDGENLGRVLQDRSRRAQLVRQLMTYLRGWPYAGLQVDFQELPSRSLPSFHAFLTELAAELHTAGMQLAITLPVDSPQCDYAGLSKIVDFIVLEAYDQHWPGGPDGPLAGVDWFSEVVQARRQEIPAEKMVIGLASYAYDWKEESEAASLSFDEAMLIARDRHVQISTDPVSLNPTFAYRDEEQHSHRVWFLDATTGFNEVATARPFHPGGIALWRLGTEDPSIWRVLARHARLDTAGAEGLTEISFRYRFDNEGEGEVFQVTEQSEPGRREIVFDPSRRLITSERFVRLPSPYVLRHYGTRERKVALTFDDGPDPRFTPAILDVLRAKHAPATFFVIGTNGRAHPDLLRREVAEGHEIGNHSFTHPYLSKTSGTQLRLEVTATERVIESAVQRQTLLFRPPYAEFDDPKTPEAIEHLWTVNHMGYLVVGDRLDTDDWRLPGAEAIVHAAVQAADRGEGHVVLMHDSGGDRSQTVEALPHLIDALRARGYELVTISGLLGRPRDAIMQPLSGQKRILASFNRGVFGLVNVGMNMLASLFVIGIVLGVVRLLFVGILSVTDGR